MNGNLLVVTYADGRESLVEFLFFADDPQRAFLVFHTSRGAEGAMIERARSAHTSL